MAGRHTEYEDGVVIAMTGAMMLPPDVAEAGKRIEHLLDEVRVSLAEAKRVVELRDYQRALIWLEVVVVRIDAIKEELGRDFVELDKRQAEIHDAARLAFPQFRIVAELPKAT